MDFSYKSLYCKSVADWVCGSNFTELKTSYVSCVNELVLDAVIFVFFVVYIYFVHHPGSV